MQASKFILAKEISGQIMYFIWHRGHVCNAMEVDNRIQAINLTSKNAVLCAETNLVAGSSIPVGV